MTSHSATEQRVLRAAEKLADVFSDQSLERSNGRIAKLVHAVRAMHKAEEKEEAVAWIWHYRDGHKSLRWRPDHDPGSQDVPEMGVTPLYTHPSPTKEPDPCSIEGMIASERRKEGPK